MEKRHYFNKFVTERNVSGRSYLSGLSPYQTFSSMLGSYQLAHSILWIMKKATLCYVFQLHSLPTL